MNPTQYIRKRRNRYYIQKRINGRLKNFRPQSTLQEAIEYRDRLIANNWEEVPLTPEEQEETNWKHYYRKIGLNSKGTSYRIHSKHKSQYIGTVSTIEEALYYRDLYADCPLPVPKPQEIDLQTDNPYLIDGLMYPLPSKLIKKPKKDTKYGKGTILQKSISAYSVRYNHTHYTTCRTYEQAYYVRQELQKCDWDKDQLPRILDDYPKWYTWLIQFYQYVSKVKNDDGVWNGRWKVVIPREYAEDGKLEYILYGNLEDALFERDFLKEHEWDYELLVYNIDDRENPYYDMELPPYPQRKRRNNREYKDYREELEALRDYILDGCVNQVEVARLLGTNPVTLRNWLVRYNTDWSSFKDLVLSGEDIWDVLELPEMYFTPDLSPSMPPNYNGHISKSNSKRSPYIVARKREYYGCYKDRKTAEKVVKELEKVNWDKSYLPEIQEKVGYEPFINTRNWVYKDSNGYGYYIRKKDKNRRMIYYGHYKDKKVAEMVRDLLIENDWDKNRLKEFRRIAEHHYTEQEEEG